MTVSRGMFDKKHAGRGVFDSPGQAAAHVRKAVRKARAEKSALADGSDMANQILGLMGMSGKCTRHMLNNLCTFPGIRYVEVGSHLGSTYCSALYNNKEMGLGVSIDNWSQFVTPGEGGAQHIKKNFVRNARAVVNNNNPENGTEKYTFYEADYNEFDFAPLGPIDFYFFDGPHHWTEQKAGILKAYPALADTFIFLVDDWNWPGPQEGTEAAIAELGLHVHYRVEIYSEPEGFVPQGDSAQYIPTRFAGSKWHNGVAVFVMSKTKRMD